MHKSRINFFIFFSYLLLSSNFFYASETEHTNEVYSPTVSNPSQYEGWVWVKGTETDGRREEYMDGKLQASETYLNGELVASEEYEDEIIVKQYQYSSNSVRVTNFEEGERVSWEKYQNDILVMKNEYDESQHVISRFNYYPDGTVSRDLSFYENGNRKLDKYYDENGVLTRRDTYKKNVIIESNYYDDDGKTLIQTDLYENGNKITGEKYQDGKVISNLTYRTEGNYLGVLETEQIVEDDEVVSELTYNYKEEVTKITDFIDGQIDIVTVYKGEAVTRVDEYENDVINSTVTYNAEGNKSSETIYEKGIRTTRETYDSNGDLHVLSVYSSDGENYSSQEYYDEGQLSKTVTYYANKAVKKKQVTYSGDTITSEYRYYENGNISYRKLNAQNGDVNSITEYYKNGKTKAKKVYENNVRKLDYRFTTSGAYTKTFFMEDQTIVRRDYYNIKGDKYKVKSYVEPEILDGYKLIKVNKCSTNTTLQSNVVVDIGVDTSYTSRTYYAYTNDYGQLERVDAALIVAQNESREPVVSGSNGKTSELRYCKKQANISATQSSEYDRGHAIADSLGGAANAYNLTPQAKDLNRYGAQFEMEELFRAAFNSNQVVTDFTMKMEYKSTTTNIPYKYIVSYKIDGEEYNESFLNK